MRTCLQIKSYVRHNLLKTIIALAVVLRVFGNLSPRMKRSPNNQKALRLLAVEPNCLQNLVSLKRMIMNDE